MPELPEIEIIKRGLAEKITGLKIDTVEVLNPKSFQGDANKVKGTVITKIWRRGKILGINLLTDYRLQSTSKTINHAKSASHQMVDGQLTLLFHLKMSGQIILVASDQNLESRETPNPQSLALDASPIFAGGHPTSDMLGPMPNNSTRVIFHLSSPIQSGIQVDSRLRGNDKKRSVDDNNYTPLATSYMLFFNDQRKFGWIKLVDTPQLNTHSSLLTLGPEPLDPEFTWQVLKKNLVRHKSLPIKVALLDQTLVAGIGNIYTCETCFIAKINPRKKVSQLNDQDFQNLHQGIIHSLNLSIKKGGSSRRHFFNEIGQKGHFLDFAYVYDRYNMPCKICSTSIAKIKLGGRGTYFCPNCQE